MIDSFGPYRILRRLGAGGMGEVYLAEDARLGRHVAVKVLGPTQAGDPEQQKRLRREAMAVARLDHPNICTVYEVGEWERGTYLAMQAVEGTDLGTLLTQRRFTFAEVISIGIQAADVLMEAHDKGILHRDLKPQNLMLTPRGLLKVLDFGLAKPLAKEDLENSLSTGSGYAIGTVPYMSPEQVRGEALDGRSDLFSLGLVLYELATGQRAFQADSAVEVMAAILREAPRGMETGDPTVHPALRPILTQLLEKDRGLRTPSARGLLEQLRQLHLTISADGDLQNLPTVRVPLTLQVRRLLRRPPRWVLAGGIAAGILGAGLAGWGLRSPRPVESLAVLPIGTDAADAEVDYVADGLTEQLINQLSRLPGLRVISRTSILRYKGQAPDLPALARELGVDSVLTGHLGRRQDRLDLHLELVSTGDRRHLWGERVTGSLDELGDFQSRVTRDLGRTLNRPVAPGPASAVGPARKVDSEAYRLYLQGRFHQDKWTPVEFQKALICYDQALAKDPTFALAPAAKATAYWNMSSQFLRPVVAMAHTKEEARLALSLDPELPEAHVALAGAQAILDWDFPAAEASFHRALQLDPKCALALEYRAYVLIGRGRGTEALALLTQARKLDPMSPILEMFCGWAYLWSDRPDLTQAESYFRASLARDPDFWWSRLFLAWTLDLAHHPKEAAAELEKAKAGGSSLVLGYQGYRLARAGDRAGAEAILKQLMELTPTPDGYPSPHHIAMVHAGLGNKAKALEWLLRAKEGREEIMLFLTVDPTWAPLRDTPGFKALLRDVHAPQ
ncbi:MAG TPA: protein kinase [Holophagaceae bacterium]|nr:protein kinase [Holophagaceae bacterium]